MTPRLTAKLLVSAIRKKAEAEGGHAMVLSKGDAMSGSVLLAIVGEGRTRQLLERSLGLDDIYRWTEAGPEPGSDEPEFSDYLARRRNFDPDIWVVELDLAVDADWLEDFTGGL
ncbi:MAG: DUF1491 family protein [Parasphingopyxis sp.]|nr:DUF1491 family protein [Sphingomonadales bacterium]